MESGFVYEHRNITLDLKDEGEICGKNRVYKIMKEAGIKYLRGYKRHRGFSSGKTHHVAENVLNRAFSVATPNKSWVTDFTYIRTHQGWLYLTVVIDLFSRKIIGWSMKKDPRANLVIDALLMVEEQGTYSFRSWCSIYL
jgi:putative transposase